MSGAVVLLVDDQPVVCDSVRHMLARAPDVTLHVCTDPALALETAAALRPTVILQDLVMPRVDGLMLLRFFRALEATRDVPIVVLSAREDPATKAEALSGGANDYLVKLPDPVELIARVRYHSSCYAARLERDAAYAALSEARAELAEEVARAAAYARSILPEPLEGVVSTRWHHVPCTVLGGDAFGYQWLDEHRLGIYLLDVCGHGVGAALLGVSVVNLLASQALTTDDLGRPADVLATLNRAFRMAAQNGMYFTMWYGVLDTRTGRIAYSAGAHPAALLLRADGERVELSVGGTMVGIAPDVVFEIEHGTMGPGDRLFLFSDGAFEITLRDGSLWDQADFVDTLIHLAKSDPDPLAALYRRCQELSGKDRLDDDFTIVEVSWNR